MSEWNLSDKIIEKEPNWVDSVDVSDIKEAVKKLKKIDELTICRKCKMIIENEAYCWENHMDKFHPYVEWKTKHRVYLSKEWFRNLTRFERHEEINKIFGKKLTEVEDE